MATNKQRREAERRRLQRQLEERRARQASRQRFTLIASILGTLVVIAAIVVLVVIFSGGDDKNPSASQPTSPASSTAPSTSPSPTPTTSTTPAPLPTLPCRAADNKLTTTFLGVTVGQATNLKHEPKVTSKSSKPATVLECADLVVGKGTVAKETSTVTIQYTGALYTNGKVFDSSWANKKQATFPLANVIAGFRQAIGGAGKVTAMHVGSRRIMILPASLAYGATAQGAIPANSTLVFVVDLTKVG